MINSENKFFQFWEMRNGLTLENWPDNGNIFIKTKKSKKKMAGGPWNLFQVIQMVPIDIPKGL